MTAYPKPRPRLLDKRQARAELAADDRVQRAKCRARRQKWRED